MSVPPGPAEADAALMAQAAAGDRPAFSALCARHLPRLYVLALRVTDDPADAEEVAQDAMVRAWRNARAFDPARGSAASWLNRIAVNLAVDRRRAARPAHAPLAEEIASSADDPEWALRREELRTVLTAGLAALPERQRAAFVLTYGEDRSGAEAAGLLGVSTRALEGLLRRARLSLRDFLQAREV